MEDRNGLVVDGCLGRVSGTAEREAALAMIDRQRARRGSKRITLTGDRLYDVWDFVQSLRARNVTPHIAVGGHLTKSGKKRKTAINRRTTRHPGYVLSQRIRKQVEEIFGWGKGSAGMAKTKFRGTDRVEAAFLLSLSAYKLIRLPKLLESKA